MKNRKGFTLVELLVVIAIIAILATVAIIGYTSFVEKAEKSVDYQVAEQLNTALEADEAINGKPEYLSEVFDVLRGAGFAIPGALNATYEKHTFVWDPENNVILVVEGNSVVYPEEYSGNNAEELLKQSNLAIPTAKLTAYLDGDELNKSEVIVYGGSSMVTESTYKLDAVYKFETTSVPEEYMDYYVDFVIEVEDDLKNVAIAGNYGSFGWIAVEVPEVPADFKTPLIVGMGFNPWKYSDIVSDVGTFYCAIADLNEEAGETDLKVNSGANVTVKLCMWADENDAANQNMDTAIVVNIIEYTFE